MVSLAVNGIRCETTEGVTHIHTNTYLTFRLKPGAQQAVKGIVGDISILHP
jgi:hypothetical protein